MVETLTGIFRQPYKLQLLVSESQKFQEITNSANAAEAFRYTRYPHANPDVGDRPPLAIIFNDHDRANYQRTNVSQGSNMWRTTGTLFIQFLLYVPREIISEVNPQDANLNAIRWILNTTGQVMLDIENLSGLGEPIPGETHINIINYSPIQGPERIDPMDAGFLSLEDLESQSLSPDELHLWGMDFEMDWGS